MRWSCPHCGVNLAVADDKLGSGWSFSRCYKCGGFALVRRAEVNIIKVDKAPVGENVLLPEDSETPVLSRDARKNFDSIVNAPEKPTIIPAVRKISEPVIAPATPAAATTTATPPPVPKFLMENNSGNPTLTPSVPHVISAKARYRVLPMAIGVTGAIAVTSGIYLFIQGEAIWSRVKAPTSAPMATIAQNAIKPPIVIAKAAPALVTDQLHQMAMAPARPITEQDSNAAAVKSALTVATRQETTDNSNDDSDSQDSALTVRVKTNNSKLRAGPGLSFRIVGLANPGTDYVVLDWRDRWFKIGPRSAANSAQYSAWIRNDLVNVIKQKN